MVEQRLERIANAVRSQTEFSKRRSDMIEQQLERIANALEVLTAKSITAPAVAAPVAPVSEDDFLGGGGREKKYTVTEVLEITKETAVKVGREKVIALIKKYGATKASDVPEDKFSEFIDALGKLKK